MIPNLTPVISDPAGLLSGFTGQATPDDLTFGHLSPEKLAETLGVSVRTLQRWHRLRQGPPRIAVGKLILYKVDSVRDWLSSQEINPAADQPRRRRRGV